MSANEVSRFTKRTKTHQIGDNWRVKTIKEYRDGRLANLEHHFILEGVELEHGRGPIRVYEMPLNEFADVGLGWQCANSVAIYIDLINLLRQKDTPRNRVVWDFVKAADQYHYGPHPEDRVGEFYTFDRWALDAKDGGDETRVLAQLPPPEAPVSLLALQEGLAQFPQLPSDIDDSFLHVEGPFFEATRWPVRTGYNDGTHSTMYFGMPADLFGTGFDFVRRTSSYPEAPWDKMKEFLAANLQPSRAYGPRD